MDSWISDQIRLMKLGGNDRCNAFLQAHGVSTVREVPATEDNRIPHGGSSSSSSFVRQKYDTPAAELYRQVLQAELHGQPVPTELPAPRTQPNGAASKPMKKMEGFGSTPAPTLHEDSHHHARQVAKRILYVAVPAAAAAALWLFIPH